MSVIQCSRSDELCKPARRLLSDAFLLLMLVRERQSPWTVSKNKRTYSHTHLKRDCSEGSAFVRDDLLSQTQPALERLLVPSAPKC